MTIEQAIASYEKSAERYHKAFLHCKAHGGEFYQEEAESNKICYEHDRQLAAWLRELQETRKERDYWQEKAHSYEQTIYKLTDAISKQPEIVRRGECAKQYKPTCPFGVWINTPDDGHCHWAERRTE